MYSTKKICDYLYSKIKENDSEIDYELFSYGYKILEGYITILFVITIVGIISNSLLKIYTFVVLFSILRKQLGGFHFESSKLCFFFSIFFSILIPFISSEIGNLSNYLLIALFCILIIITNIIGVVDNKNKRLSIVEKRLYKRNAIMIEIIYLINSLIAKACQFNYLVNIILLTVIFCVLGNCLMCLKEYIINKKDLFYD